MLEVSKRHPGTKIQITGKGEDPEDVWRKLYLDGEITNSWELTFEIPNFFRGGVVVVDEADFVTSSKLHLHHLEG